MRGCRTGAGCGWCGQCPPRRGRTRSTRAVEPRWKQAERAPRAPEPACSKSFSISSSDRIAPFTAACAARGGSFANGLGRAGGFELDAANRPPSPLPGPAWWACRPAFFFQRSESALAGLERQRSDLLLGSFSDRFSANAAASVVLPTPPLPPKKCRIASSLMGNRGLPCSSAAVVPAAARYDM